MIRIANLRCDKCGAPIETAPSDFVRHFHAHVIPQLRNLAKAEVACILAGCETYEDACDVLLNHAEQLGAGGLPHNFFAELMDWIPATLLKELDAAERVGEP